MENLIQYIKPELLIVSVLLYGLGAILKKTKLKDNFIPLILGGTGVISASVYLSIMEGFTFASIGIGIVQGLLCAACSTYVNQIIKQMQKLGVKNADFVEDVVEALDDKS